MNKFKKFLKECFLYTPSVKYDFVLNENSTNDNSKDSPTSFLPDCNIFPDLDKTYNYLKVQYNSLINSDILLRPFKIEIYGTTLHYAPCGVDGNGFKAIVVLPQGTNTDLMTCHTKSYDDKLLTAKNKWLIAHEEAGIEGAVCGLKGENIDLAK